MSPKKDFGGTFMLLGTYKRAMLQDCGFHSLSNNGVDFVILRFN